MVELQPILSSGVRERQPAPRRLSIDGFPTLGTLRLPLFQQALRHSVRRRRKSMSRTGIEQRESFSRHPLWLLRCSLSRRPLLLGNRFARTQTEDIPDAARHPSIRLTSPSRAPCGGLRISCRGPALARGAPTAASEPIPWVSPRKRGFRRGPVPTSLRPRDAKLSVLLFRSDDAPILDLRRRPLAEERGREEGRRAPRRRIARTRGVEAGYGRAGWNLEEGRVLNKKGHVRMKEQGTKVYTTSFTRGRGRRRIGEIPTRSGSHHESISYV